MDLRSRQSIYSQLHGARSTAAASSTAYLALPTEISGTTAPSMIPSQPPGAEIWLSV